MAKYEKIAEDLQRQITTGELSAGERLPAETDLRDRYRVSLPTIRQALGVLRAAGVIESRHGIGTYVRVPSQRTRRSTERYHVEKARVQLPENERSQWGALEADTGMRTEEAEFGHEYCTEPAPADLAEAFGVPPGTPLLSRTYQATRVRDARPLHLIHSYLVQEVAAQNPDLLSDKKEPWPGGTQHQLSTIGIELGEITEYVTARPPTPAEAELLGMGAGEALIYIRKVSADTGGRVVEISDIYLPGDQTELVYTTKLEPWE